MKMTLNSDKFAEVSLMKEIDDDENNELKIVKEKDKIEEAESADEIWFNNDYLELWVWLYNLTQHLIMWCFSWLLFLTFWL